MKNLMRSMAVLAFAAAAALPARAEEPRAAAPERLKAELNQMVLEVKAAGHPAEKRAVLNRFFAKVERGASLAERIPVLPKEQRAALAAAQERFGGYSAELNGAPGQAPVADADLDAFASFVQQDVEQAAWRDGGIYISAGVLLLIILIILLLA